MCVGLHEAGKVGDKVRMENEKRSQGKMGRRKERNERRWGRRKAAGERGKQGRGKRKRVQIHRETQR